MTETAYDDRLIILQRIHDRIAALEKRVAELEKLNPQT